MKIWIITSWLDVSPLFRFLVKYNHEYILYCDDLHWPYGDKTFDQSLIYVKAWIDYLTKQWVDYIIVPPMYELYCLSGGIDCDYWAAKILPLFATYLKEYCFAYSLVGKIGIIGNYADIERAQLLFQSFEKEYRLTSIQAAVKKFHFPFVYRCKEVPLRKYFLRGLSYSNVLVNKIVKFDLRYFKDAMVDTLVPLDYWYFAYQSTITNFLNFKKIRFHTTECLENIFATLIDHTHIDSRYSLVVVYTWHPNFLQRDKKFLWFLQRGQSEIIQRKKI